MPDSFALVFYFELYVSGYSKNANFCDIVFNNMKPFR